MNEEEFHAAVSESTSKILLHGTKVVTRFLRCGDVQSTLKMVRERFF